MARQYCRATGQVENCQVMPMLTYASAAGHAFINRRLYLPEAWAGDLARRADAGVPEQVVFRTKPELVIDMLEEERAAATPFRWLTGDAGYGRDPHLRAYCHDHRIGYVMAVPVDLPLVTMEGQAEPACFGLPRGHPRPPAHHRCPAAPGIPADAPAPDPAAASDQGKARWSIRPEH